MSKIIAEKNSQTLGLLMGKMEGMENTISDLKISGKETRDLIMRQGKEGQEAMMRAMVEMNDALKLHLEKDDRYQEKNDGRVDALEKDKVKVMGIAAGIAAVATGGINGVLKLFGGGN